MRYFTFVNCVFAFLHVTRASKFSTSGPALTFTIKDQEVGKSTTGETVNNGITSITEDLFSLSKLNPSITWSIQSTSPPLPTWIPFLKSCYSSIQYKYDEMRRAPTEAEAVLRFVKMDETEVIVQPSYSFKAKKANLNLKLGNESLFGILRISASKNKRLVEHIRASYKVSLPFRSLSSLTLTPAFDFANSFPSFVISGETGTSRTIGILDLNMDDPKLSVIHSLDKRNTISPQISLLTAKIIYSWKVSLDNGSIMTKVDPTSSIHVTWRDNTKNGNWITDFKLPLEGSSYPGTLAADIRVRRQFQF